MSGLNAVVFRARRTCERLYTKLAQTRSDIYFLTKSKKLDIVPKGLRIKNPLKDTFKSRIADDICHRTSQRLRNLCLHESYKRQHKFQQRLDVAIGNLKASIQEDRNAGQPESTILRGLDQHYHQTLRHSMTRKDRKLDKLILESPLLQGMSSPKRPIDDTDPRPPDEKTQSSKSCNLVNLSQYEPSQHEVNTLNLGLSYCPPRRLDKVQLCFDVESFNRRVKLREFFSKDDSGDRNDQQVTDQRQQKHTKERTDQSTSKPRWTPPGGRNPFIDRYTSSVERHLDNFLRDFDDHRTVQPDPSQRRAIKSLQNNVNIIIKPADKGGAVVIQDKEDYITEATRQLSDEDYYTRLDSDPTTDYVKQALDCVDNLSSVSESQSLVPTVPRVSEFYMLPKIHKLPKLVASVTDCNENDAQEVVSKAKEHHIIPPGRPIISSVKCLTECMSEYVDKKLQTCLPKIRSYVKDTTDFLNKINSTEITNRCTLVTMDVKSLYTNIPHEEGVQALQSFLRRHSEYSHAEIDDLATLAEFILKHNYFKFDGDFFLQSKGTAMGTKMAPAYANIFMAELEEDFLSKSHLQPSLYLRYIDDIFMIWPHDIDDLKSFHERFDSHNGSIKFTMESSCEKVHFLDVTVTLSPNGQKLQTSVYTKPTDSFTYLNFNSFHPTHIKESIVYSQLLRYKRITSDPLTYESDALQLGRHFIERGYPINMIKKSMKRVSQKNREDLLVQKSKHKGEEAVPFVSTYHPKGRQLALTFKKEWPTIKADEKLAKIMPRAPLHAQRQPPNLKRLLVRNQLPGPAQPRGNKPCGKSRCQICPHILTDNSVRLSSGYTIYPPDHNCDSSNILYCFLCDKCPEVAYIGETSTRFRVRFNNHRCTIRQRRTGFPVAEHFSQADHSLSDLKICLFGGGYKSADERKLAELRTIIRTKSFQIGLNRDLSWLEKYSFFKQC